MSDPNKTLPLALALGLLLGLAGGQLLGSGDDVAPEQDVLAAGPRSGPGDMPSTTLDAGDDPSLLAAEIERLTAELDAARGGDRRSVEPEPIGTADGEEEPAEGDEVETIDSGPALELLLDELGSPTYREAHRVQAETAGPMSLAMNLVYTYQNQGQLADALRILDLARTASATNEHWQVSDWNVGNLAQAFENAGDRATATRLYLDALRLSPQNWSWADRLAELDPAGGLAILRELQAGGQHEGLEVGLARLLAASGDLDEALAGLRDEDGTLQSSGWDLFMEHDPEAAEAALIEAARGDDPFAELGLRLARHLIDGERNEEAIAELERLLAAHPDNPEVARLLAGLDTDRGLELAAAEVAAHPDSTDGWGRYADLLTTAGRTEEALEARLRAFELSDSAWIPHELLAAAPERVLPMLQERADRSTNDELWGDLADSYWRAGRHEQAKAAWLRARTLDSDDGEWSGKLAKLEDGIDPLGENGPNMAAPYFGGWGSSSSFDVIEDFEVLGY